MKLKRKPYKRKYIKPKRRSAKSIDSKAKSMQTSYRKYTGQTLTLDRAREIIASPPKCPYCNLTIQWNQLSYDHIMPSSRGGEDNQDNLVLCCGICNRQKGNLTGDEYKALLAFLDSYPIMKESVLLRLRAGGAALRRRRRWQ